MNIVRKVRKGIEQVIEQGPEILNGKGLDKKNTKEQKACNSSRNSSKKVLEEAKGYYQNLRSFVQNGQISGQTDDKTKAQLKFHECFSAWKDIRADEEQYKKAERILTSYYATDKIRSHMLQFQDYVEKNLDKEKSSENIILRGFNGCVNFIWLDYQRLMSEQDDCSTGGKKDESDDERERLLLCFLQEMACKNKMMAALAKAYSYGRKRLVLNQNISDDDEELKNRLKDIWGKIKGNEAIKEFGLKNIESELKQQLKNREAAIEDSRELMKALKKLMVEARIRKLQDETADQSVLTERYREFAIDMGKEVLYFFP